MRAVTRPGGFVMRWLLLGLMVVMRGRRRLRLMGRGWMGLMMVLLLRWRTCGLVRRRERRLALG